jgi:hypothetical protein
MIWQQSLLDISQQVRLSLSMKRQAWLIEQENCFPGCLLELLELGKE